MCEIGKKFSDIQYYNKEMQKGMEDKLFFLDKLPQNQNYVFVDFGCADGSMINALTSLLDRQQNLYIGYDISETMIDLAKTNYHGPSTANVTFTTDWNEVLKSLSYVSKYSRNKLVLILSSVIHEVYSYADKNNTVDAFWNKVLNSNFDYIIIRDMCPSNDIDRESNIDIEDKIRDKADKSFLNEFEAEWGSICNNKNLIHFLLKYRWKINWKRECYENYFPIYVEELLNYFKKFNIDYFDRFKVDFMTQCWIKDFGVGSYDCPIDDYTHVKAIFSKKK